MLKIRGVFIFWQYLMIHVLLLQGMTRLMLTKIPFFKEVVLCSFRCEQCGFANSEIQSAGRVQELGVKYTLQLNNMEVRFHFSLEQKQHDVLKD